MRADMLHSCSCQLLRRFIVIRSPPSINIHIGHSSRNLSASKTYESCGVGGSFHCNRITGCSSLHGGNGVVDKYYSSINIPGNGNTGRRWFSSGSSVIEKVDDLIEKNKVMIFSKSTCPFCYKVKALFYTMGVTYEVIELNKIAEGAEMQAALLKKSGQRTVPNVYINGQHLGGASDAQAAYNNGRLKEMLKM